MQDKSIPIFYPKSQAEWRKWLQKNHTSQQSVWVVFYKKASGKPTLTWSESVDEALCFGWIDSKKISIDHESSHQFFCKRKPKSTWSKINKDKIEQLIAENRMTEAGMACIEIAKQNGSWTFLDCIDSMVIPDDLELALKSKMGSKEKFEMLSNSKKKLMLYELLVAKTTATRDKRIAGIMNSIL